ncbi:uncharacterized protein LOC131680149 [Topomyia yanbarensis]|uniref:uncharacterized protein LOC131680149 n=1 Tax=Topomyia yanbarensis TaxID=2498891 RepID=UPI00273A9089|nr:uncharacterized protein LOC131680149 [Topomyia yanbarensis]
MSAERKAPNGKFHTTRSPNPALQKPKYLSMIVEAIITNRPDALTKRDKGLSVQAVKTIISSKYLISEDVVRKNMKTALVRALNKTILKKSSGIGLSGSLKLHKNFITALKTDDTTADTAAITRTITRYLKNLPVVDDKGEPKSGRSGNRENTPKIKSRDGKTVLGKKRAIEKPSNESRAKKAKK